MYPKGLYPLSDGKDSRQEKEVRKLKPPTPRIHGPTPTPPYPGTSGLCKSGTLTSFVNKNNDDEGLNMH